MAICFLIFNVYNRNVRYRTSDLNIVYKCRGRGRLRGGGGGTKKRFLRGGSAPSPTPYPFKYDLWQKKYTFSIPSSDKWYPFHMPSLEPSIPSNFCERTVHKLCKWLEAFNILNILGRLSKPPFKKNSKKATELVSASSMIVVGKFNGLGIINIPKRILQ